MLGERLREILAAKGISKDEWAELCDLPVETIRNIYYGKTPDPKVSTVMKIYKALSISVNCLMGECSHSAEERALLQYFRSSGHHGKSIILLSAKNEALTAKEERESKDKHAIPCLIPHGDMQQGIFYDNCEVADIYTAKEEAYVAIMMSNNDHIPTYCKGDILLIANRFPSNKEYGVFYQNGRAFIRQYIEEENQYRLKCLHNFSKDMVFKRLDQIEYMGTCCGVVKA
jgi:transcriptional regulator with XRE-family HTH domain